MKILDIKESLLRKNFPKKQNFKVLVTKDRYIFIHETLFQTKDYSDSGTI